MKKDNYPEGEVYCAVCNKPLISDEDKERGFHRHCEAEGGLTKKEMSSLFCKDDIK